MVKALLVIASLLVNSPELTSYNVSTFSAAGKSYVGFNLAYSEPLPGPYQASFDVTYSTAGSPVTLGYVIIVPAGTFGPTGRAFEIPVGYTIASWELTSSGPYVE